MLNIALDKFRSYKRFLRLTEFDQSTDQGLRDERYRRALLVSGAMIISRAVSLFSGLFTVHIAISVLGAERFGAWNSLIMVLSVMTIMDIGIPASLVNRTAQASAKGGRFLQRSIAANILIVTLNAIFASLICAVVFFALPWITILNTENGELLQEVRYSSFLAVPILLFQMLNTGYSKIVFGLQRGFLTNVVTAIFGLATFGTTLLAKYYAPTIAGFFWATQGANSIVAILLLMYLLSQYRLDWRDGFRYCAAEMKEIWALGRSFFGINVLIVLAANLDVFLASALLNPVALSELVAVQRLFQVFLGINAVMVMPLWAAYADASARGDHHFIRITLFRSLALCGIYSAVLIPPVVYFSSPIFSVWTQNQIVPDLSLVLLVAASTFAGIFVEAFNVYLNGCGILRPQLFGNLIYAVLGVVFKTSLALALGIKGIVIAGILSYVLAYSVSYCIVFRHQTLRFIKS